MTYGNIIKAARKNAGLTQKQLGKVIGIEQSAVWKYENEALEVPNPDVLEAFSKYFGMTITADMKTKLDRRDIDRFHNSILKKKPGGSILWQKGWNDCMRCVQESMKEVWECGK